MRRCPIKGLEDRLLREDPATAGEISSARKDVEETVSRAVAQARAAQFPTGTQALAGLSDGGLP
jgi:TPP-dependent pyruvate/acetoin dehydrogenase alpha subunit